MSDTMVPPEFSRPLKPASLDKTPQPVSATATPAECEALAQRFDLISLNNFKVEAEAMRWRSGVRVTGTVTGKAVQRCIVTLDPVPAKINESFDRGFLPERDLVGEVKPGAEIEIEDDPELGDLPDLLEDTVDLGEIAAETLGIALDPYPRSDAAEAVEMRAAPPGEVPMTDEDAKPFASLAAYRETLAGKKDDE